MDLMTFSLGYGYFASFDSVVLSGLDLTLLTYPYNVVWLNKVAIGPPKVEFNLTRKLARIFCFKPVEEAAKISASGACAVKGAFDCLCLRH